MTKKIWVGSENNYGIDYRINDNNLIIIYDTCYSSYELDNDGIYWNLVSDNNSLLELN